MDRQPDRVEYARLVLFNDERTPRDLVLALLRHVAGRTELEAQETVRMVEWMGRYSCGVYPAAVAEAFVESARRYATERGHDIRLEAEPLLEAESQGELSCSFCGARASDARKLLAGKSAAICDACVLNGAQALSASAPQQRFNFAYELLEWHFAGIPKERIAASSRAFPERVRADLQRAAERIFGVAAVATAGLHGGYEYERMTMTTLLQRDRNARTLGPLRYQDVDIGEDEPVACLENALFLRRDADMPVAVLLVHQREMRGGNTINIEVAAPTGDAGRQAIERMFHELEAAVREAASYRGKVLSLELADSYSGMAGGILVHRLPAVSRDEVILPASTLELLERNVIGFARKRESLRKLGLSLKKGVLFHGPPGTGKTHTVRYLASALPGHTTFLITAEQVALLPEYFTLARLLQPSIVVIEDADLVARDRSSMDSPCEEVLLNKLLNEMDGLKEDAAIFFVLSTNRPEALEAALASRPGRIDQAIEFPLPDDDGRRKLVRLYGRGMRLSDPLVERLVERTRGVSASFIKELMRRTAQYHLERAEPGDVGEADAALAMEEMLFSGGRLNASLLGSAAA